MGRGTYRTAAFLLFFESAILIGCNLQDLAETPKSTLPPIPSGSIAYYVADDAFDINKRRLYLATAGTSEIETLRVGNGSVYFNDLSWSKDGARLACGYGAIHIIDVVRGSAFDTTISFPGAFVGSPTWSSDGRLAYWHEDSVSRLSEVWIDGKPLMKNLSTSSSPAWSPDNKYIVVGNNSGLVKVRLADTSTVIITSVPSGFDFALRPAYSPDGTAIVFELANGDFNEICLVDSGGSNFRALQVGSNPTWSPDGSEIAYDDHFNSGDYAQIYVINITGGTKTRILAGVDPAWKN